MSALNPVRAIFYWFFPPVPKKTYTKSGGVMRRTMQIQVFFHFVFFVGTMMAVGMKEMLFE